MKEPKIRFKVYTFLWLWAFAPQGVFAKNALPRR